MTKRRKYNSLPRELPRFDPEESFRIGLGLLREAGVSFAVAGRLAVWAYVPPAGQRFTKDVDFAVPHGENERAAAAAREAGYRVAELFIGGYGIRGRRVAIDYIDRHPHLARLFSEAVESAQDHRLRIGEGVFDVPVVPLGHLIAMKLVSGQQKDDRDVESLLTRVPEEEYRDLRRLVMEHLGYVSGERLDSLARRIGHRGPGMRYRHNKDEDDGPGEDGAGGTD